MKPNRWFFLYACLWNLPLAAQVNMLVNGDFSQELDGWEVSGAVFQGVDVAVITDENAQRSVLFQGVSLDPGTYAVTLDFSNLLSSSEPSGFARDSFFASLYLSSTPDLFDPLGPSGFEEAVPLFDLDFQGPVLFTGSLGDSPSGSEFMRFSGDFVMSDPFTVFAVLDLSDLNGVNDDSIVLVDQVTIVPEPASALLFGLAAGMIILFRRRK